MRFKSGYPVLSLHRALAWLALVLQVEAPQRWRTWMLRLVLLPPGQSSTATGDPARVPDPAAWLALQFELPPDASYRLWVWRLFVRPAPTAPLRVREFLQPVLQVLQLLAVAVVAAFNLCRRALRLLLWPLSALMQQLDALALRIDTERIQRRADAVLMPVLAIPGLRWFLLLASAIAAIIVMTTPFNWLGQFSFLVLCWACSMVLRRLPGRFPAIALSAICVLSMGRYAWWRLSTTLEFNSITEALLGLGLLAAEAYTWLVVVLGFIQTAWPLNRPSVALPANPADWPSVDVFIPTYNEPLSVVRPTTLAVLGLDWPKDKLHIHILDDGKREEFREFARSVNVGYIIRSPNTHAKAGNLNHALGVTSSDLIAIFDCDHLPVRSFLKATVGWLVREPKCALVQTPHHFFSPDPFEKNLGTFRSVPNEGALFYGLIQDGNDFWDATFFCGSCAVIRREPLMAIGGVAVETVTEDAHTALKLQRLGYSTAYIDQTLAAGLATESLSAHIGQRIRWARGMAQIFRTDNPFLGLGLSLWQRICYASAMLHFFFGIPRLVFLTAPMAYLFFQLHVINTGAPLLALYVLPYILQSNIANAHTQGEHRHSFWAEVYETVLAWYVALPTTIALIKPKAGTFNVTAKGGLIDQPYFDWTISRPYIVLVLLNFSAFFIGLMRLFFWNTHEIGTVLLNLFWCVYSMILLGAAVGVASESRQVRRMHRVAAKLPAILYLDTGEAVHCQCVDFSMTGLGLRAAGIPQVANQTLVHVGLWSNDVEYAFPCRVTLSKGSLLGVQLEALDRSQEIALVQCTFARPNVWDNWNESHDLDRPLNGLLEVVKFGLQGYVRLFASLTDQLKMTLSALHKRRMQYHS